MKKDKVRSVRFSNEDDLLIAAIKQETGVTATAEVLRMGLRALIAKLGIRVPASNEKSPEPKPRARS